MDGVIIDGMQFHVEAWLQSFGHFGAQIDPRDIFLLEGVKSREVVSWICSHRNVLLSNDEQEAVAALKRRIYAELFRVEPFAGGPELVRSLADLGYRLALVTGTSRFAAAQTLRELRLEQDIAFVVSSESVARGKPAPEPYLRALALLNVPAECCLAIENAPPGVSSAISAGLGCMAVATYLPMADLIHADKVFEDLGALKAWFTDEYELSLGRGPWSISD